MYNDVTFNPLETLHMLHLAYARLFDLTYVLVHVLAPGILGDGPAGQHRGGMQCRVLAGTLVFHPLFFPFFLARFLFYSSCKTLR